MTGGKNSTKVKNISKSCSDTLKPPIASRNHCSWRSLLWMVQLVMISSFKWVFFYALRETTMASEFRLSGTNNIAQWRRRPNLLDFYYGYCPIFRLREVKATRASPNTSVPTVSEQVKWWVCMGVMKVLGFDIFYECFLVIDVCLLH